MVAQWRQTPVLLKGDLVSQRRQQGYSIHLSLHLESSPVDTTSEALDKVNMVPTFILLGKKLTLEKKTQRGHFRVW